MCHLVAGSNDGTRGGLEETVDRLASHLAVGLHARVVVYTMNRPAPGGEGQAYRVDDLSDTRTRLAAPLSAAPGSTPPLRTRRPQPEEFQINRLALLARVQAAMEAEPDRHHVLVSFFMTTFGFTAQLVAQELGLPHVAVIAGSDLNRDAASPAGRAAAAFVIEHAAWIVANNNDQVARLARLFGRKDRVTVSPGSLPADLPSTYWAPHARDHVGLVADCGYSFKKATHCLVDAFIRLRQEGHRVRLTVVGGTDPEQADYWRDARNLWTERLEPAAQFHDRVPKTEVERLLLDADIYCSASLGEGSPQGALFALALGMPLVVPAANSIADLTDPGRDRVALFRPGDLEELYRRLAGMVRRVREGSREPDRERINALRRHLRQAEGDAWTEAIESVVREG